MTGLNIKISSGHDAGMSKGAHGDLKAASVGSHYPYIVYARGYEPLTWHIQTSGGVEYPETFTTASEAHDVAQALHDGDLEPGLKDS